MKTPNNCGPCAHKQKREALLKNIYSGIERPDWLPSNAPLYVHPVEVSRELDRHHERGGRGYSQGHQKIYKAAIEILSGAKLERASVLEIGPGIGYGLGLMLAQGLISEYLGVEPDAGSYGYLKDNFATGKGLEFHNAGWLEDKIPIGKAWEFSFCVEVIEHVPPQCVPRFLAKLRRHTLKTMFLSTPDAVTSKHGVAPIEEWQRVLRAAGWDVAVIQRQWTTLYVCNPSGRF